MVEIIALFFIIFLLMLVAIAAINIIILICKVRCLNVTLTKRIYLIKNIINELLIKIRTYNNCTFKNKNFKRDV